MDLLLHGVMLMSNVYQEYLVTPITGNGSIRLGITAYYSIMFNYCPMGSGMIHYHLFTMVVYHVWFYCLLCSIVILVSGKPVTNNYYILKYIKCQFWGWCVMICVWL